MQQDEETQTRPRVALICHHDAPLHFDGLARWIASWGTLAGIVIVQEPDNLRWKRLKRERRRVGLARVADVLAFRAYYRFALAQHDDGAVGGAERRERGQKLLGLRRVEREAIDDRQCLLGGARR